MKRTFILIFSFLTSLILLGQDSKKSHWLMVSVYEDVSLIPHSTINILVTSDDGTQKINIIKRTPDYSLKHFKENEDSVFVMLQPFFADGWKLTATSTLPIARNNAIDDYLTRYFFCKQDGE